MNEKDDSGAARQGRRPTIGGRPGRAPGKPMGGTGGTEGASRPGPSSAAGRPQPGQRRGPGQPERWAQRRGSGQAEPGGDGSSWQGRVSGAHGDKAFSQRESTAQRRGAGSSGVRRASRSGAQVGGDGRRDASQSDRRGGSRLAPKGARLPDPAIPADATARDLEPSVRAELRTLSPENAEGVAGHLVMVGRLLDEDPQAALAHAETAVRRAGRVAAVREARGVVAYHLGDWATALSEFRTARRLSGSSLLLPLMVDCERALGRRDRALELASTPEARDLPRAERVELAIVVSGIRRDAGQFAAAAAGLELPELASPTLRPWTARLRYAYAEARLGMGDEIAAREWFARAVVADPQQLTDAVERLELLDGVVYHDLDTGEDEQTDDQQTGGAPDPEADPQLDGATGELNDAPPSSPSLGG